MDDITVHYTITQRIISPGGSVWEFFCHDCGYQARYIDMAQHGEQKLEILDVGDPAARHTNNSHELGRVGELGSRGAQEREVADEESWLTPELRKQIEDILAGFDWQ